MVLCFMCWIVWWAGGQNLTWQEQMDAGLLIGAQAEGREGSILEEGDPQEACLQLLMLYGASVAGTATELTSVANVITGPRVHLSHPGFGRQRENQKTHALPI
jgi:hypothetical protein